MYFIIYLYCRNENLETSYNLSNLDEQKINKLPAKDLK